MKIEIYQIIVPVVGIVSVIISLRQFKRGFYTGFESGLWIMFWSFISLVAIFPDVITVYLSKSIGIKDHINAIIFIGLAILFFLNFKLFNNLKKQNRVITELIRKIAIDTVNKDGNKE